MAVDNNMPRYYELRETLHEEIFKLTEVWAKKITTKVEYGVRESVNMAHLRVDKTEKGHSHEIL